MSMRGLFKWAVKNNHVKIDPTATVDRPQRITSDGIPAWTEEMVEAYERRWPIGTRERVWLDILLYTGLRVGDAFRFGKQHVRAGEMKTEKLVKSFTRKFFPCLPRLWRLARLVILPTSSAAMAGRSPTRGRSAMHSSAPLEQQGCGVQRMGCAS
jgi:integrase